MITLIYVWNFDLISLNKNYNISYIGQFLRVYYLLICWISIPGWLGWVIVYLFSIVWNFCFKIWYYINSNHICIWNDYINWNIQIVSLHSDTYMRLLLIFCIFLNLRSKIVRTCECITIYFSIWKKGLDRFRCVI